MDFVPKKCAVVPCDFSDEAKAAVAVAMTMVDDPAHVHVIHVLPELAAGEPGVVWGVVDDKSRHDHATEELRKQLDAVNCKGVDVEIAFGDPGREIVDYAEKIKADLIVMPSHGRTGLPRLLIGSVAERVLRLAHCPVLVLRK